MYQRIAIKKFNILAHDSGFIRVSNIDRDKITLEFQSGRKCTIDNWGRVTWITPGGNNTEDQQNDGK